MTPPGERMRQAAWFVGLWLAGVAVLAVAAWVIRWWLLPG
jgi:hypothetical protein